MKWPMVLRKVFGGSHELRQSPENPSTPLSAPADWLWDWATGGRTKAGARVNEDGALHISAFYCGVRVLTDAMAQTPLMVYRRLSNGGRERAPDHPLYTVLHDRPNPLMSAFTFRETLQGHCIIWGNAYAEIEERNDGSVAALWPLLPDRTDVIVNGGKKFIRTRLPDGQQVVIPGRRVLHIPGFGFDGLMGRSLVRLARESLGLTKAAEEFGSTFFGAGSKMAGVLSHPGLLSKKAKENLRESWNEMHQGLDSAHRIGILEEGLQWTQIGVPPDDAQFLQTRQHQVTEVARWLKVPPHKIMDLMKATFSNIEQQNIQFLTDSMVPWFTRWEQELTWALLSEADRREFFTEFLVDGLLRGDSAARGEFYTKQFNLGSISPNEIAILENRNPVEGGDQRFVPLNLIPLELAGDVSLLSPGNGNGTTDDDEENSRSVRARVIEGRQVMARQRVRSTYRPLLERQATRTLNKELIKIRRAIRRLFAADQSRDLFAFLDDFYDKHDEVVARDFLPIFEALAGTILEGVLGELNGDERLVNLTKFLGEYADTFGKKWAARSRKQLQARIRKAGPEKSEELEAALTGQLDEWERSRAAQLGRDEAVKGSEAFSRFTYAALGVILFRWITVGENCEMCDSLSGKIVGSREVFASQGETIGAEGNQITPSSNVMHPPLHSGCDCVVIPG